MLHLIWYSHLTSTAYCYSEIEYIHLWFVAVVPLVLTCTVLFISRSYTPKWSTWTGFGEYIPPSTAGEHYQRSKTLWDWMQLLAALAVPLALGIATYTFNMQQAQAQQDQQQEAALQSYLDHMSDLLLGNNTGKDSPSLAYATYNSEISQVARSRTLTILRSLDGRRKGLVLQFLYEAELIGFLESPMADIPASPVIILIGADLSGADLSEVNLRGAVLAEVNLEGADLSGADLSKVDLSNSDLRWANLSDSFISQEQLDKTYCQGATLPKQLTCANKTPPSTKFPLRSRG